MEIQSAFWSTLFASVVVYWLLPRGREWFLIAVSFAYLCYVDVSSREVPILASVPLVLVWFAVFYLLGRYTRGFSPRARAIRGLLIVGILLFLGYFKYFPPFFLYFFPGTNLSEHFGDLVLPLGISYLTFKLIHYVIDVSQDQIQEHSPRDFLLYLIFFTIFPAGPIERFDHFLEKRRQRWEWGLLAVGGRRIIFGLIKKFVLADMVVMPAARGVTTQQILDHLETTPVHLAWLHVFLWFVYSYLEFSAYCDIAIGGSRLFGFEILENFNFPLVATNIGDFWQRWHMTLCQWCRAYVYMPMIGFTRNPTLAVIATMLAIALWHAASFGWVLWGLYHAAGLLVYRYWMTLKRRWGLPMNYENPWLISASRLLTLAFVSGSYTFLVTQSFSAYQSIRLFLKLFGITLPQSLA